MAHKSLGQHFLVDESIIELIIATIAPQSHDTIVEIGPGRGALTWPLLQQVNSMHAIEVDHQLGQQLQRQSDKSHGGLRVHCADALLFDYARLCQRNKLRLVGNLPYNIASPLLFRLFATMDCIADMHFMLQAEVAQNLVAQPRQPAYSRMSIMAACYVQVQCLFDVEAQAFSPPPKVRSTFVKMVPQAKPWPADQCRRLHSVVKKMFAARRKTLGKIFSRQLSAQSLAEAGIPPTARPSDLHRDQLLVLLQLLQPHDEHDERTR